jgi:hypothetical protein
MDSKIKCEDCYYFAEDKDFFTGRKDLLCKNPLANPGEPIPCGWKRCAYLRSHENECGEKGNWWKPK